MENLLQEMDGPSKPALRFDRGTLLLESLPPNCKANYWEWDIMSTGENMRAANNPDELCKLWEMMTRIPEQISIAKNASRVPLLTQMMEEQLNKLAARQSLFLPILQNHNESVLILSDYGGESADSKYQVFSLFTLTVRSLLLSKHF
jgi:hypothetical protein